MSVLWFIDFIYLILMIVFLLFIMIVMNFLPRGDGNRDEKLGVLSSSQCGLVELAAFLFYRVVTRYSAIPGLNCCFCAQFLIICLSFFCKSC